MSPLARRTASEKGVDLSKVQGTGPNSRVILADVEDALKNAAPVKQAPPAAKAQPKPAATATKVDLPSDMYKDMEVSQIRKVIAERLTHSKQNIPHYYVTIAVNMDRVMSLRAKLNAVSSSKISVNDIVMKAAALAALKVPQTNSSW